MFNKENSYKVYICGVGGQGIIKSSVIMGEAAMNEGYDVVMSEIHGMSQRGGVVSTELKIGDYESQIIEEGKADMILSFEPIEAVRALNKANKDTKIIFNTTPIVPSTLIQFNQTYPNVEKMIASLKENYNHVYPIDGNKVAIEIGNVLYLNMVLLGGVVANDAFPLSKKSIIESMKNNLPSKFHEINLDAIERGHDLIKNS